MKMLIKLIIFCALFVWVGMAIVGFFFAFTNWAFLYNVTPFVGLFSVICIIKCAMYVLLKSDPIAYMNDKYDRIEALIGKKKI